MNKVLKIAFLLAFALIASAKSFAQNNVTAKLLDAVTGEPVGYATASLTPEGSETVYKYTTSSPAGAVTIESVRDGKYTFRVELMGYKTINQEVEVKGAALNLGEIKLEGTLLIDAVGRARQDNTNHIRIILWKLVVRHDFAERVQFTNTTTNQLSGLRTKVQNDNFLHIL